MVLTTALKLGYLLGRCPRTHRGMPASLGVLHSLLRTDPFRLHHPLPRVGPVLASVLRPASNQSPLSGLLGLARPRPTYLYGPRAKAACPTELWAVRTAPVEIQWLASF